MVPIPDDIRCSHEGYHYVQGVGRNGETLNTNGGVEGVSCWILGKRPGQKKEIPLASTEIAGGMLATKQFGNLQITFENNIQSDGFYMAIGRDKVESFRDYLQK